MEQLQGVAGAGAGCRDAEYLAAVRLPGGGRLVFGSGGSASAVPLEGGVCIVVPRGLAESDVESSALGELYASLLLAAPETVEGDEELYWSHAGAYAERVAGEENWRLRRLLGPLLHGHAYAAPIGLLVARMSRLARLYVWLRPVYNETLRRGVRHLHRLAERYSRGRRWLRLDEAPMREPLGLLDASPRAAARLALEAAGLDLLRSIPAGLLLEGFSTRPLPPLRDPLLYVRLDAARVATRLLRFEDQLYALTNVARLLRLRRSGLLRSTRVVEAEGFRPAVVKHYRDPTMGKWLFAAILSLPLPKPRIAPKQRLGAEYHYNRVLASKGYPVPSPILVDPRRMKVAYTYIEGKPLSTVIQEEPASPAYRSYGALLARLHGDGIALWDTNPSNALLARDTIYLVDLEQAREAKSIVEKAWDIAVAAYYSIVYTVAAAPQRAMLLAQGYIEAGGDPAVVAEASKYRYAAPFAAATPPNVLEKTRRALAAAASRKETP